MSHQLSRFWMGLFWALWALVLVGAFWLYQITQSSRDPVALAELHAQIEQLGIEELPEPNGHLRLLHFLDPLCPCTAFTLSHMESLAPWLEENQVRQWLITPDGKAPSEKLPQALQATWLPNALPLAVGPAVAIWDGEGTLAYFGPYSLAMVCGEDELLIQTMEAIIAGQAQAPAYSIETGCFCAW